MNAASKQTNPRRNAMLARIHAAKKALGMSDEDYRLMLWDAWGVTSAGLMRQDDLENLARQMETQTGKKLARRPAPAFPGRPQIEGHRHEAQLRKIEALLASMTLPWDYVLGEIQRRMGQTERINWENHEALRGMITALEKEQAKRVEEYVARRREYYQAAEEALVGGYLRLVIIQRGRYRKNGKIPLRPRSKGQNVPIGEMRRYAPAGVEVSYDAAEVKQFFEMER
ncbi:MAG: regulatory protein GemA [Deltaproteobacteria bacterium]|nr:regulatory protein GemA [Deltaproteobacteria bacterium]